MPFEEKCVWLLFLKLLDYPTFTSLVNHLPFPKRGHILCDFVLSWSTHPFILLIKNICPPFIITCFSRAQLENFFLIPLSCFVHSSIITPCLTVIICLPICLLHRDVSSCLRNIKPHLPLQTPVICQCVLHCEYLLIAID